ncbi:hypothetical protein NVI2019_PEGOAJLN_00731 [Providencia alcalifaciens]|uniref:hypothetical protein n=1 Tax=Providencia alcalifaciens TaxID=126385 RepID=UPI001CC693FC|nr:hypothetical protein [Providencia alcalifaciens]CAG9411536.1 hypothetical protein NVI2019_PEGOAJLN_00731 [Providencia alcalifaciens]
MSTKSSSKNGIRLQIEVNMKDGLNIDDPPNTDVTNILARDKSKMATPKSVMS